MIKSCCASSTAETCKKSSICCRRNTAVDRSEMRSWRWSHKNNSNFEIIGRLTTQHNQCTHQPQRALQQSNDPQNTSSYQLYSSLLQSKALVQAQCKTDRAGDNDTRSFTLFPFNTLSVRLRTRIRTVAETFKTVGVPREIARFPGVPVRPQSLNKHVQMETENVGCDEQRPTPPVVSAFFRLRRLVAGIWLS